MPLVNLSDTNYGTKNDRSDFALAYYLLIRIGAVITLLGLPVSTIVILWFDVWNNFQLLNFNSWMFGLSPIALLSSLVTLFAALQLLWEDWKQTQKIFKNKRPDESVPDKV